MTRYTEVIRASLVALSVAAAGTAVAQVAKPAAKDAKAAAPAKDAKAAPAKDAKPEVHVVATPASAKWEDGPPNLPAGLKIAVLNGDLAKAAPFSVMLKMPAGYKFPPHWHTQDENVIVISGTFYAGMGDKLDEKNAAALGGGAYVFMPAKMHHYAFAKNTTVIELHGVGPFDITWVNPKDDPAKAEAPKK